MSEINANIVVEPINLTITQTDPGITITPEPISLNIFTGGYACAQGNTSEVQYNAGGYLAGASGLKYYSSNNTTQANILIVDANANVGNLNSTGNVNAGNIIASANVNSANADLGNTATANYFSGTLTTAAQPNITSVGNLTSLTVVGNITAGNANLGNAVQANYFIGNGALLTGIDTTQISNGNSNVKVYANGNIAISSAGTSNVVVVSNTTITLNGILSSNQNVAFSGANVSLGNVSNVEITGGTNGYVLQTDGTGNLSWTAMTGNAGNGTVGGANTQIQFNDAGIFGGAAGFTFDKTTNVMNTPGNIIAAGNVSASYFLGNGSQLTGISQSFISNGNSNVRVFSNSNITISAIGNSNTFVFSDTTFSTAGNIDVTGTTKIQQATEKVQVNTGNATGTINFDVLSGAILYYTGNATANFTLNIRGNSTTSLDSVLSTNNSLTCTFINVNETAYIANAIQVDGISRTIKWTNGLSPNLSVVANSISIYNFNLIKTASNTYTIIGSILPGI